MPKPKEDKPVFVKVLDASTCHITAEDNEFLSRDKTYPQRGNIICDEFPYGYYVYVQPEPATELASLALPISASFKALLAFARQVGATHIKLDCDGEVYSHLPVNDW